MKKADFLKQMKARARINRRNRRDSRFLHVMGFLVAKGFLKTNYPVTLLPNKRLNLKDAIWAGQHVEPRILEVLPAAVLRLQKHFDFDSELHKNLARILDQLRKNVDDGDDFFGIPYPKLKQWRDIDLLDGRTKPIAKKKITKTFRLRPEVVARLAEMAKTQGRTITDCLEKKILEG